VKRKWIFLISIAILTVGIVHLKVITSEKNSVSYIQNYLHNKYKHNFQYIKRL